MIRKIERNKLRDQKNKEEELTEKKKIVDELKASNKKLGK